MDRLEQRAETYPVTLFLPGGVRAELAPGMAVYRVNRRPIDVDLVIPEDVRAAGWFWSGSYLCQQNGPAGALISIATVSYPPPGVEPPVGMTDCFTCARQHIRVRTLLEQQQQPAWQQERMF